MRKLIGSLMLFIGLNGMAFAQSDPSKYLESIALKMISVVETNKEALKKDPKVAENLVKKHLLPVIDQQSFAKRTLGKKIWTSMSEQQRTTFIKGYIEKVINKYAKGLALYDGQAFVFQPAEISKKSGNARVKSSMKQEGAEPLDIHYYLSQNSDNWLITNIIVAGTDMRKSYKSQFRPRIKEIGIEQFLQELSTSEAP